MQSVLLTLVADSLMAVLLVVTIFYCLRLNKRIRVLQDSKSEFSRLISRFDDVTKRAQESIAELQTVSQKVDEKLSGKLDKANFLADDLAFMIEKGNKVANKASSSIASASSRPAFKDMTSPQSMGENSINPSTLAAKEKLATANDKKARRASIEAVMDRIATNKGQGGASDKQQGTQVKARRATRTHARLRSRAEQELHEAIKSGN